MGGLGRLRASSRAVLGDSESAESRRRTEEGPSERMAVSLRMTVGRTLHQVSTRLPISGSVCMAVSARPQPGPWPPGSSGPRQTSMRSEGSEPELHRALEAQEETLEPLSEAGDSCCSTPLLTAGERGLGHSGARLLPSLGPGPCSHTTLGLWGGSEMPAAQTAIYIREPWEVTSFLTCGDLRPRRPWH